VANIFDWLKAWHGSPHDFDAFDFSHMGKGEGAQVYGKGGYTSESKDVAQMYKDQLGGTSLTIGNEPVTNSQFAREFRIEPEAATAITAALKSSDGNKQQALNSLYESKDAWEKSQFAGAPTVLNNVLDAIKTLEGSSQNIGLKNTGKLYEVGLDVDPQKMMDWREPLSIQPKILDLIGDDAKLISDKINKRRSARSERIIGDADQFVAVDPLKLTGKEVYRGVGELYQDRLNASMKAISDRFNELDKVVSTQDEQVAQMMGKELSDVQKRAVAEKTKLSKELHVLNKAFMDPYSAASNKLRDKGVQGIQYLGEFNRTQGEGVRNYVNFNADEMKILNKYLRPETVLATGVAGGAALQSEDAEAGWVKNAGGIFTPDDARIATRFPTAKSSQENPILNNLIIDVDSMLASGDKQVARNAELLRGYNTPISSRRPDNVFNDFRDRVSDNLLWMFDQIPEEVRDQSKLWYDGANKLANQFASEYQASPNAVAGVMAALSPQKDWYMNVSLAERLIDVVKTKKDFGVNDDIKNTFKRIYGDEKYAKDIKAVESKPWEELSDVQKAMYVRGFDETYNNRAHRIVSADGQFMDFAKTAKGEDKKTGWGSNTEIAKAISVLENPTQENISKQMGGMHKVRNFYNNIIDPNAKFGDVTIDTHAVAAGLVEPFSGKSIPVAHNFGTGSASSASTGAKGTYGVYADAYRQAAEQAGVLPREMQSITWEGVRGLFPAGFKSEKNVKAVNDVMALQKAGKISLEEARNRIVDMAGGIDNPSWYREGRDIRDIQSTAGSSFKDASIKGGAAGSAILAALANNSFAGTDVPDYALPMSVQAAGQSDLTGVANPGRDFGNVAAGVDMLLPLFMESIKPATMGNAELTEEQRRRGYYNGM